MKIGEAFVEVKAKTDQFEQGVVAAGGRAGKGVASSLGNALTGVLAGGAAVKFLTDSFNAATNLNEAISLTGQVFQDSAGTIESFASTSAESVGLAEADALSFANTIGGLFIGMGTGREEAARLSTEIVTLGADLASAKNLTGGTAEALEILRSGLVGEVEPLRRVGVALSAARVEQQALAETGKTSAAALTEGEKAAARYSLIMEDLGAQGVVGDFQRTAEGAANQQRSLSAAFTDAQASIGQKLTPAILQFINAAEAALPLMESFGGQLDSGATAAAGLATGLAPLAGIISSLNDDIEAASGGFVTLFDIVSPGGGISVFTRMAQDLFGEGGGGDIADEVDEIAEAARRLGLEADGLTVEQFASALEDVLPAGMSASEALSELGITGDYATLVLQQLAVTGLGGLAGGLDTTAAAVDGLADAYSRLNNMLSDEEALIQARQALRDLQAASLSALEGGLDAAEMDDLRLNTIGYARALDEAATAQATNSQGVVNGARQQRLLLYSMQAVRNEIPEQMIPMWDRMIRELGRPARLNADGTPARREVEHTTSAGESYSRKRFVADFDADASGARSGYNEADGYGRQWDAKQYSADFIARYTAPGAIFSARGGPYNAGELHLVGENGPELFVSGNSGTIVNNGDMSRLKGRGGGNGAGWGGGGNMVNVNVPGLVTAEIIERVVVPRVMLELDRAERRRGF